MYCLPDRHVGSTCQSFLGDDRDSDLCFNSCCSTPLVALGHVQGKDGVGVTQNMNITYHAPVSMWVPSSLVSILLMFRPRPKLPPGPCDLWLTCNFPFDRGATIEIASHSVAMGSRVMNSRCEVSSVPQCVRARSLG